MKVLLAGLVAVAGGHGQGWASSQDLRSGKGFLAVTVYSAEEDQELLKLFDGLRAADVSDGMDKAGRRELYKQLGLPSDASIKK